MPFLFGIIVGLVAGLFIALAMNPRGYLWWLIVAALIIFAGGSFLGWHGAVIGGMVVGAVIGCCGKGY